MLALTTTAEQGRQQEESPLITSLQEGTQQRLADYDRDRMIGLIEALKYAAQTCLEKEPSKTRIMSSVSTEDMEDILFWR